MKFISVTEAIRNILKHCKLLKDINIMDMIRHHYGSRSTGSSSHYVQYIIKITRFYTIMASITGTNFIQTLFRCTQTVDKSPTKAIWIIYIILAESSTRHAPPIRIQTLMSIQINFQSQLPKCVSMIG